MILWNLSWVKMVTFHKWYDIMKFKLMPMRTWGKKLIGCISCTQQYGKANIFLEWTVKKTLKSKLWCFNSYNYKKTQYSRFLIDPRFQINWKKKMKTERNNQKLVADLEQQCRCPTSLLLYINWKIQGK